MSFVVTLISNPAKPAVTEDLIEKISALLPAAPQVKVLRPQIAVDLAVEAPADAEELESSIRTNLADAPVDVFIQPQSGRRKKLLIADMDSTMIQQECIDELAAELGLKEKISDITERAMRGEIEFEPALRERVALLKGLGTEVIGKTIENRITLTPGGRELVQTMKANGGYAALVSGGFTSFTRKIADVIGFDENKANTLLEVDGKLSGEVAEPILGKQAKLDRLNELTEDKNIALEDAIAVGDGANDLAMICAAGLGVAFHAKPKVAAEARAMINHGDLTALLYLQGYSYDEFVKN
ncbi:protein containing Phosphoserine phosphatase SerB // Haloacid dehalogenase-like hydrolase [Pseudovibrio sp. FO-BEG1]|uniref:phosphoserine phosphatase SerB n=1 Tax=Pseudovibrio sp. (strain FO-BEG1) TaxID=911045 RepID=UPI000238D3DA|nr:phosphoserine phosphatase SerB [Pseudovibrio sp. FO-BEG1]AEV38731.1 protein containing Phosphoserine phosphatase SerB // Haloacid dehalogenase-like hydrolase [Pseudovibrio sp. FO-BEG1]